VDLGHLEVRVNRRLYRDEVVVGAQAVEERTEIWKRHGVNDSITNPLARPRPIRTIKETGELFGVPHVAGAIPESSGGFNTIFMKMVKEKANYLDISLPDMISRLRSGDAELLGVVLSTGIGAEAYRQWEAREKAPPVDGGA
jgi:hypothetical protein